MSSHDFDYMEYAIPWIRFQWQAPFQGQNMEKKNNISPHKKLARIMLTADGGVKYAYISSFSQVIAIQITLPSLVHERSNITCNTRAILTIALWLKSESIVAECNNAYSSHYPDKITFSMMTSSNGNIFRVTGHLCGDSPVPGEFPAQRPVTRSF